MKEYEESILAYQKLTPQKLNFDDHSQLVLELFRDSKDFFTNFENSTPDIKLVEKTFLSVPDGVTKDKKILLGVFLDKKLIGFAELIKDRHKKREWLLSLLLLSKRVRKTIIGGRVLLSIFDYIKSSGATCVIGGVVEENKAAKSFWRSIGAIEMDKIYDQEVDGKVIPTRVFYKEF